MEETTMFTENQLLTKMSDLDTKGYLTMSVDEVDPNIVNAADYLCDKIDELREKAIAELSTPQAAAVGK
jgi:hypothetical protein